MQDDTDETVAASPATALPPWLWLTLSTLALCALLFVSFRRRKSFELYARAREACVSSHLLMSDPTTLDGTAPTSAGHLGADGSPYRAQARRPVLTDHAVRARRATPTLSRPRGATRPLEPEAAALLLPSFRRLVRVVLVRRALPPQQIPLRSRRRRRRRRFTVPRLGPSPPESEKLHPRHHAAPAGRRIGPVDSRMDGCARDECPVRARGPPRRVRENVLGAQGQREDGRDPAGRTGAAATAADVITTWVSKLETAREQSAATCAAGQGGARPRIRRRPTDLAAVRARRR